MKTGQEVKKIGICMLFAASCFIAAFVLMEFHGVYIAVAIAGILLMISAYLMLTVVLAEKIKEWSKPEEEEFPSRREARATEQFRKQVVTCLENIDRTQQAMLAIIKSGLEQQKEGCSTIENAIEKLAAEQLLGVKTVVKYNKENARQLALNERQSLSDINENISKYAEELKSVFSEGIEKSSDEAMQLPLQTESIAEESVPEEAELMPEVTEEVAEEIEPVPEVAEEEAAFDPNAKLSPEDITKLSAAAEETVQPEQEEPQEPEATKAVAEEEAAFDPNAKLSPEDIAKLFASMGS